MKKILSCLGVALFTFSFSYSQKIENKNLLGKAAQPALIPEEFISTGALRDSKPAAQVMAPGDTVFSETFTGSLPAGWTQSVPDQIWKWIDSAVYKTPGCYSTGTARLKSTTATGGTMIFDGDSAIKGGAPCPPSVVAKTGSLVSPTINLSGAPYVHLKYQQKFRLCCNTTTTMITVSVSGDGGTTWTDFDARHGISLNQTPLTNPDMMDFNITAVAGGQANVVVKFTFTSESGTYYWEIDDVAITESYVNEMVLNKAIVDWTSGAYGDEGGFYTLTPANQRTALPTFRGITTNDGVAAQTNAKLKVSISDGTTTVYNDSSSTVASYAPLFIDTMVVTTPYTPPTARAVYNVTFNVAQNQTDQNSANNTTIQTFEITDTVYGRDNGIVTGSTLTPSNYVGGNVNEGGLGNTYEIYQNDEAMAVQFYLESNTRNGASIEAGVYPVVDPVNTFDPSTTPVIVSQIYDVVDSAVDAGKWVTLPLVRQVANDYKLYKDSVYIVAVKNYNEGTTSNVMRISSDLITQQPNVTSWVRYLPAGMTTFAWGWIGVQPRIRLITKNLHIGINELASNGLRVDQNFPNPFNSKTLINYEVNKSSKVTLEVYDITGNLVYSQNEGSVGAGKHSIELNTKFAAGAYTYTLRANEASLTKKMMVTN